MLRTPLVTVSSPLGSDKRDIDKIMLWGLVGLAEILGKEPAEVATLTAGNTKAFLATVSPGAHVGDVTEPEGTLMVAIEKDLDSDLERVASNMSACSARSSRGVQTGAGEGDKVSSRESAGGRY